MTGTRRTGQVFDAARARAAIAALAGLDGPLLPALHAVQAEFGWVPDEAIPLVADVLNLSRAEVHGVLTFYHDFRRTPPARHALKLCRAEACQAMGADQLARHAVHTLSTDFKGITADQRFSLDAAYCLGNCAAAPAMMVDERLVGRVTPEVFDAVLADPEAV